MVSVLGGAAHKTAAKAMVCLHAREQGERREEE